MFPSLHTAVTILTWAIPTFGVAGVIAIIAAVLILGPAVAIPLIQDIVSRFIRCTACVIATAIVLGLISSYWLGHHAAVVECREAELAAELRNKQIDLAEAKKAKADETARANNIEASSNDQHQKDLAEIEKLKSRPATCAFDDLDAGTAGVRSPARRAGGKGPAPPAR